MSQLRALVFALVLAPLTACVGNVSLPSLSGGECGSANGVAAASAPTSGLCALGTPTGLGGSGPWSWSCVGSDASSAVACSAPTVSSTPTAVNGQCGASNGTSDATAPTTGLCAKGTASNPTGNGPWAWSCAGSAGGTTASCQASLAGPTGGQLPPAGNPDGSCSHLTLPAEAQAVDTSHPTHVVGTGTAASCTFAALNSAVSQGGIITFNCGSGLTTIPVTSTLTPPVTNAYAHQTPIDIVIDGGGKITLDGQSKVRILLWNHAGSFRANSDTLTLQHIRLVNGAAQPTEPIPACPAANGISNTMCSQGYNDGQGGAIDMTDGSLRIIDATFSNNQAALRGPDTGGGAIYALASLGGVFIAQSTFTDNKASNGGGVGLLWSGGNIYNSLFSGNAAVGDGANNNDPTQCTCMNNGQNEIGSGGNGGAMYKDGADPDNLTLCGNEIEDNTSNEFGAAAFLTADGGSGKIVIDDTVIKANSSPVDAYWEWCTDVSTDEPHQSSGSGSPPPVSSSFCGTSGTCSATCSS